MKHFSTGIVLVIVGVSAAPGWGQEASDRLYEVIRRDDRAAVGAMTGSDVRQKDKRGGTPLHYAAAFGSLETLRSLLEKGADVDMANDFGATPLMFAVNEAP